VAVHVTSLLFDPYAQLRLVDLAVPFLGADRPLWLGLGTLAADVLVVIVASSLLRHRIGPRVFRTLHWSAYALWPVAFLHALGSGTDTGTRWFHVTAIGCAVAVGGALGWRTSRSFAERGFARVPRREPRKAVTR
jgi:sulfoxide reductase heme-binding subunit YedZ